MKRLVATGALLALSLAFAGPASAQSGMVGKAAELPPIKLASGEPLAEKPLEISAGKYYEIKIVSDGSAEKAISGAAFFRNLWIDEIVINDIEIRPLGLDSIEFDDEGEAEISFIAIKPGVFELTAPGTPPLKITVK
jgi:DNA-binding protein